MIGVKLAIKHMMIKLCQIIKKIKISFEITQKNIEVMSLNRWYSESGWKISCLVPLSIPFLYIWVRCSDLSHPFPLGSLIWKNYCNYRYNKQGSNPCLAANEKHSAKNLYNTIKKELKLFLDDKSLISYKFGFSK